MMYRKQKRRQQSANASKQQHSETVLTANLEHNLDAIRKLLESPNDLVIRQFVVGNGQHACALIFIDGLADKKSVEDTILHNIQLLLPQAGKQVPDSTEQIIKALLDGVVSQAEINKSHTMDDVMLAILSGNTAFLLDGSAEAVVFGTKGWRGRSVEEPVTESVVRGPRDGFTESIRTNTSLIRRRISEPNLRFKSFKLGRRSRKDVFLAYIDGIANPSIIDEAKRRLESIDIDYVPESGTIEQWIEDSFLSPFPQILHTERPDKVAAALTEGRIAILLDGTPFVLILPITLGVLLLSPEDYYERWQIGTLIRFLRYVAAFIALFLPSLYVALVSYQPGLIPSKLAFSIAGSREGVPFPAIVEALMMEITLELLREAGIRLPKPIGQTIGIVGGLVIGEAAVAAGIVSPIMVIVVAITAISSFTLPSYSFAIAIRIIRFGAMLAAGVFGLFGIIMVYIMINIHIANLKSFGVPYSTPFAPFFTSDWKDLLFRAPLMMLRKRPQMLQTDDENRATRGGRKS
ncbi:spore germination protein [Paenibacillus alkalitolerans]|uniref:spore germination protein n=1 Tax=Paenibacillus alkalitolerans TaxID=2799335 RepID=UPI0018F32457